MKISFNNVIPVPLKDNGNTGSDIWLGGSPLFESGKTYKVAAGSGMGKTTMLSIMFGIRKDYEGEVLLDDKNIRPFGPNEWASLRQDRLSCVFQGLRLFPELSALENISVKNYLTGYKSEEEIKQMADRLNVSKYLHKPAAKLSFGQQQRIAIIRALCQPLDMLLLDEPFSHLDKENINLSMGLIESEIKKQGAGLILTSLGDTIEYNFDKTLSL